MANLKVNLYGMEFLNPIMTAADYGAKMVLSVKRQQKVEQELYVQKLYLYYQLMYQDHVWQN